MTKDALRDALKGIPADRRLAAALAIAEVKQQDIAERCGLSDVIVSRIVTGHRQPTDAQRKAIAKVLGVPAGELFGEQVTA